MTSINLGTGNDIVIEDNDFSLITGRDEIGQVLKQKLKLFLGEFFLDTTKGIDYFGAILGKNKNPAQIDTIFKEAIVSSRGIIELISYKTDITDRSLRLDFVARTSDGILTFSETLINE